MSEATPEKRKRLGVSPQDNPPKGKSSWFQLSYVLIPQRAQGIKSHSLTLHKRQRVDCTGYLKLCPNGVIYP